ncbi:MAG: hypothetical protein DME15_12440 [Candidatus Rokuibacteriota bacterium]|nr:MAG: hypothetical protein DME15_12440 [Candidatus Rokubacteria bacterium]
MRERRRAATLLAGGLLALHAGGASVTSQAVDHINAMSRAPIATVAPRASAPPDTVWVPDRFVPLASGGQALVPGHWERWISAHEVGTPPLTAVNPADGSLTVYPAAVRPPAEQRREP